MAEGIYLAVLLGIGMGFVLGVLQGVLTLLFRGGTNKALILALQLMLSAVLITIALLAIDEAVGLDSLYAQGNGLLIFVLLLGICDLLGYQLLR